MRRYALSDELRLQLQDAVRDWAGAGLLSSEQAGALESDLHVDLRRTGSMLRLGLALFTVIAGAAAIVFVLMVTDLRHEFAVGLTCAVLGAAAFFGATVLVRDLKWYRHGVEETLVVGSIGLFGAAAGLVASEMAGPSHGSLPWVAAWSTCAAASRAAYRQFGFRYVAVGGVLALALVPVGVEPLSPVIRRSLAALIGAFIAMRAASMRRGAASDVLVGDAEVLRAAAVATAYLALNVHVTGAIVGGSVPSWLRWASYALTWAVPLVTIRRAISDRDQLLLRVGLAAALGSVLTNKAYLGWVQQPWDPMVLGLLLMGFAVGLRRWLASGPDGERAGFTARRLVEREAAAIRLVSMASVAVPAVPEGHAQQPDDRAFSGGRSGGAGAGAGF